MRIYYIVMKILFAAISIVAVATAVMLFVLAAIKSRKAYIGKAAAYLQRLLWALHCHPILYGMTR